MRDADGYFDERVAAAFDDYEHDDTREEFGVEDVNATVEFLAHLAALETFRHSGHPRVQHHPRRAEIVGKRAAIYQRLSASRRGR